MIHNLAALTLVVAQATAPDPLTEAALNALRASIAEAKEAQSALPPPQTDQERLERMGAIDQAARQGLWKALANVPPPERARVRRALWPEVRAVDVENQQQLLAMVPEDGCRMPAIMLTSTDLPAPLRPMIPWISPWRTCMSTSEAATTPGKVLVSRSRR